MESACCPVPHFASGCWLPLCQAPHVNKGHTGGPLNVIRWPHRPTLCLLSPLEADSAVWNKCLYGYHPLYCQTNTLMHGYINCFSTSIYHISYMVTILVWFHTTLNTDSRMFPIHSVAFMPGQPWLYCNSWKKQLNEVTHSDSVVLDQITYSTMDLA